LKRSSRKRSPPRQIDGQHKHKDIGHAFAFIARTATLRKKERGVAVVACGDSAGVRAEGAQHLSLLEIAVRRVESLKKVWIFS
jgi:hypothetical protein